MTFNLLTGPFEAEGNWYRGSLHIHTTESDGSMPPERIIRHYQMGGYDFLALTDHNRVTDRADSSTPEFLVLRGIELDLGRSELGNTFHIVGVGLERELHRPRADEGKPAMAPQEGIDAIHQHGGWAFVAHPYWSGLSFADLLSLEGYSAIEVFNTVCETQISRGLAQVHWDDLLSRGRIVQAVAVDDTHWPGFDSLRAWVMLKAPDLTRAAVVEALRAGWFYASTGPEIYSVKVAEDRVDVQCSPAQSITLVCNPATGARLAMGRGEAAIRSRRHRAAQGVEGLNEDRPLTGATFPLTGNEKYGRIQVVDRQGQRAWTNPLFTRS